MRDQRDDEEPSEEGAVDKYIELPKFTRAFLSHLERQDVKAVIDIISSYRKASTIGWFVKWLVTAMVGTFMAAVTFGESFKKFLAWVSDLHG